MNRFEIVIAKGNEKIHTFTWAATARQAKALTEVRMSEDTLWKGWKVRTVK